LPRFNDKAHQKRWAFLLLSKYSRIPPDLLGG